MSIRRGRPQLGRGPERPMTAVVPAELDAGEHAVELLLTHRGNPTRAAIIVRADDRTAAATLAESVAAIEAACHGVDDPAHRHAAAAHAWLEGDLGLAAERYSAIVIDWPHDILALVVAHALDFRLGRRRMMRDRIAQLLPEWGPAVRGYPSVLAMYAFALEENGQYRRAEKIARRALILALATYDSQI